MLNPRIIHTGNSVGDKGQHHMLEHTAVGCPSRSHFWGQSNGKAFMPFRTPELRQACKKARTSGILQGSHICSALLAGLFPCQFSHCLTSACDQTHTLVTAFILFYFLKEQMGLPELLPPALEPPLPLLSENIFSQYSHRTCERTKRHSTASSTAAHILNLCFQRLEGWKALLQRAVPPLRVLTSQAVSILQQLLQKNREGTSFASKARLLFTPVSSKMS